MENTGNERTDNHKYDKEHNNVGISGQNSRKDTALRLFFGDDDNFVEIFNKTILTNHKIQVRDLQQMDSVEVGYVKNHDKDIPVHFERDIIKKVCNSKQLMLLAIENSTYIDYTIPMKVMRYCWLNYNRQIMKITDKRRQMRKGGRIDKETRGEFLSGFGKGDKISGIVTLVIYYGDEVWDAPLSLLDMMNLTKEEKNLIADYKIMHFIDVMRLTWEQINAFEGQVKILLGFLRYRKDNEKLEQFIEENIHLLDMITGLTENTLSSMCNIKFSDIYNDVSVRTLSEGQLYEEDDNGERVIQNSKDGEDSMKETFSQMFERKRNEGRNEVIINMYHQGMPLEQIAYFVKLPVNEIEQLVKR